ncbi:hypothetical protein [Agrobacterium burrii]|uniref:Uncharacterized protein n=1 Tax=Agrobacterium burrii TaxID=2815339 RepID=A0ABS3EK53_9HYPH|nr:hypothetical protein [Agrobacterium burrii]MBO0132377.1 hypothetical protein [Agrobacterium burrii]
MTEQNTTQPAAPTQAPEWWRGKFILALMDNTSRAEGERAKLGIIYEVQGVYGGRLVTEIRMADGTLTSSALPVNFFEIDRLTSSPDVSKTGTRMFSSYSDAMAFAVAAGADTPLGDLTPEQVASYRESLASDNEGQASDRTRRNA